MAILGDRRDAAPVIINSEGLISRPTRVPFTQRKLNEGWLHRLIEKNPNILPVAEIEPAFSPVVTVGYEVSTGTGPIDLLLLSPQGYLTIVETKLWRNPEARREVVGQIVDYAKNVRRWSFKELESRVRDYNKIRNKRPDGIIASLRNLEEIDETAEAVVIDNVTKNLHDGRFLLLVVGDGIRESVEEMADYLQQTPQLQFTLALVELQIYELTDGGKISHLVIPQVVARTKEIIRAVVRVEGKDIDSIKIDVDTKTSVIQEPQKRFTITEKAFFDALNQNVDDPKDVALARQVIKDMEGEEFGCTIKWAQASFVVTLPDPRGSGQKLSLLVVDKNGRINLGQLRGQLPLVGLPEQIAYDYAKESAQLLGCQLHKKDPTYWARALTLAEIRPHYHDFKYIIQKTIDRIMKAAKKQT